MYPSSFFRGGFLALLLTVPASARQLNGWFWQSPLPQGNALNDLQVLDENTVIAAGNVRTIIRPNDDGATREIQVSGLFRDLNGIGFVSSQNGWTVGNIGLMRRITDDPMQFFNSWNHPISV